MRNEEKTREQLMLECKQSEEAFLNIEKEFNVLVNTIPALLFKGYDDWSVDFYNNKIEEIVGYSKADFDSRRLKWRQLLLPEDFERAKMIFIKALKGDKNYVREYRLRAKDEQIVWIQERGHIVCDANGRIEYVRGLFFDISERMLTEESSTKYRESLQEMLFKRTYELKRANDRLRQADLVPEQIEEIWHQSVQPFRLFFSNASVGFAVWDPDLRYVLVNPALAKINELSVEQHIGKTVDEIEPKTVPQGSPLLRRIIETGEPISNVEVGRDMSYHHGIPTRLWKASFFPLVGTDGEIAGVGSIVIDTCLV